MANEKEKILKVRELCEELGYVYVMDIASILFGAGVGMEFLSDVQIPVNPRCIKDEYLKKIMPERTEIVENMRALLSEEEEEKTYPYLVKDISDMKPGDIVRPKHAQAMLKRGKVLGASSDNQLLIEIQDSCFPDAIGAMVRSKIAPDIFEVIGNENDLHNSIKKKQTSTDCDTCIKAPNITILVKQNSYEPGDKILIKDTDGRNIIRTVSAKALLHNIVFYAVEKTTDFYPDTRILGKIVKPVKQSCYKAGDKVLIDSEQNLHLKEYTHPVEMNKYSGSIMTITQRLCNLAYSMDEDEGRYIWYDYFIVGKVGEE